jgi:hypothetical protein
MRELADMDRSASLFGLAYFTPFQLITPARAKGCLTCTHFHGQFFCQHVLCERECARKVVGVPSQGCAFWEREPGADDE